MTTTTTAKELHVGDRFQFQGPKGNWSRLRIVVAVGFSASGVTINSAPIDERDRSTSVLVKANEPVRIWR